MKISDYPEGKTFAFSIFDDTDVATLDSVRPLYDYLYELGILTTKTVWSLDYADKSDYAGSHTLEHSDYANYVIELQKRGFEIGFHGATMESANRETINNGLQKFKDILGAPPSIYAAHSYNRDNLYWGESRFSSPIFQWLYTKLSGDKPGYFQGHQSDSPYFWGDYAKEHLEYMRSFTFSDINLLNLNFPLVYKKQDTPWVNKWFMSCDAENVEEFNALLSSENQQKLERENGICIISTHLGKGFVDQGKVHEKTKRLLKELSDRNGWFVPVSPILDFYSMKFGCPQLSNFQNLRLEAKWFTDSLKRRFHRKNYQATELQYLKF